MAQLVKKHKLSKKSGLVAVNDAPFKDIVIETLTAKLKRFALTSSGDFFYIYGE